MADQNNPIGNPSDQAEMFYQKGMNLKQHGKVEDALTEFRRATISNPNHLLALVESGMIYKTKGNLDPTFWKYGYDALKKALPMDLDNKDVHEAYIYMAHKLNKLEELLIEYGEWEKEHPNNELIKQSKKNILTISMTMIPESTSIGGGNNAKLRKLILFGALGLIIFGFALIGGPVLLNQGENKRFTPDQIKNFVKAGAIFCGLGVGGFVVRGFIK